MKRKADHKAGALSLAVCLCASMFSLSARASNGTAGVDGTGGNDPAATAAAQAVACLETLKLVDEKRKKELQCRITYPREADGPCPVLIFSHGALGCKDGYEFLIENLSRHGYVCIQPTHADSIMLVPKLTRLFKAKKVMDDLPTDADAWINRAKDISFIIDCLPQIQKQIPCAFDTNSIACGGHSFGAFTTALIGGAVPPSPARPDSYLDRRVGAAILMSPQGIRHSLKEFGFANKAAWQNMNLPSLFMTGTLDNTKWTSPSDRREGFEDCPAGDKYLAVINGGAHMTFTGHGNGLMVGDDSEEGGKPDLLKQHLTRKISETMTPDQGDRSAMMAAINKIALTFLDAYLKKNAGAKSELARDNAFGNLVEFKSR